VKPHQWLYQKRLPHPQQISKKLLKHLFMQVKSLESPNSATVNWLVAIYGYFDQCQWQTNSYSIIFN
jgi:hypothetical protein